MNQLKWSVSAVGLLALFAAADAKAQVPFFNQGAAIFDPEISIVNSGSVADVTATVSADRKYVTLTNRFQRADLIALRTFAVQNGAVNNQNQNGNAGFVGGAGARGAALAPNGTNAGAGAAAPSEVKREPVVETILNRPGMTLLNPPKAARERAAAPDEAPAAPAEPAADKK